MSKIDKTTILSHTNYGIDIYAHILSECFPEDEVVLHISDRDCGLCRNPFAEGAKTLHIWVDKTKPGDALSSEFARHSATDHSIPDGDVFDFAKRYYHQSGIELLTTINNELNLRIGASTSWYSSTQTSDANNMAKEYDQNGTITDNYDCYRFSFFDAPISNTNPKKVITVSEVYDYIVSDIARERTNKLRSLADSQRQLFKGKNFDYCTFSGIFNKRSNNALIEHSGLMCFDFDHLQELDSLWSKLLQDEYFDTQLLFRSPSGDGLKWVVSIDISKRSHAEWFRSISNYIHKTYEVEVDQSGKDVSRACYLPYDPNCFINNNLIKFCQHEKERIRY